MQATPVFALSVDQVLKDLESSRKGLDPATAKERLQTVGRNTLPQTKLPAWYIIFITQFNSPLVYVLLVAAGLSWFLQEYVDASVIFFAVFIQVTVGFIQEFKAQQSLQALKKIISFQARVIRHGIEQTIPAQEVVPGDVILLKAGDKIPADLRLIEVHSFEVNEAALTGESEPIRKDAHKLDSFTIPVGDQLNMAFTGTVATGGTASGVVTTTGSHTQIGQIAQLIKATKDNPTPLQDRLATLAKYISIVVVILASGIFTFGYITTGQVVEFFTVAIAVAVSAIPEGLAIAVTVTLAIGMQRILKRKALVRKLASAETLGSTEVICTDKTGTLTEGNMTVTDFITWDTNFLVNHPNSLAAKELIFALRVGLLCNDAKIDNPDDAISEWKISGNLTERALILAASQAGLHITSVSKEAPRIDTIPFDSTHKYMATLHREAQGRILYMKGAPEIVAAMCTQLIVEGKPHTFTDEKRQKFNRKFIALSRRGLRIIALAYKPVDESTHTIEEAGLEELIFLGYVGIKDPLRSEAKATVALCKAAGIHTVMITGDHKLTAQAIAKELDIASDPTQIMEGTELDTLSQYDLNERVQNITIYARVTPEHKLRIVHAWQANGKVVAMTGDGINDSPALKAADIGVALGSGTDVAKETADMVILDDNFHSIVAGVEEGRSIFDNIKKIVLYLLSDSFAEVVIIIGSLLLGLPIPLTAAQILWLNIVRDSFPSLALTQEPKEPESMSEPPRGRKMNILDNEVKFLMVVISLITGLLNLGLFYYVYNQTHNLDLARTMIFLSLGVTSLLYVFSLRSTRKLIIQKNPFSNPWLIAGCCASLVFQIIPIYTPFFQNYIHTVPLGISEWVLIIGLALVAVTFIEIIKFGFLQMRKNRLK